MVLFPQFRISPDNLVVLSWQETKQHANKWEKKVKVSIWEPSFFIIRWQKAKKGQVRQKEGALTVRSLVKVKNSGTWYMPGIPAVGSLRQKDCCEFKASLHYSESSEAALWCRKTVVMIRAPFVVLISAHTRTPHRNHYAGLWRDLTHQHQPFLSHTPALSSLDCWWLSISLSLPHFFLSFFSFLLSLEHKDLISRASLVCSPLCWGAEKQV